VLLKYMGEGLIVLSISHHFEGVLAKYVLGCLVHELKFLIVVDETELLVHYILLFDLYIPAVLVHPFLSV
jgi:hypothetical protein